jgi:hypothetical protein
LYTRGNLLQTRLISEICSVCWDDIYYYKAININPNYKDKYSEKESGDTEA